MSATSSDRVAGVRQGPLRTNTCTDQRRLVDVHGLAWKPAVSLLRRSPADHQHLGVGLARGHHGGARVGQSRTKADDRDADFTGSAAITVGHADGDLLMPHTDEADLVLIDEGLGQIGDFAADEAEHDLHFFGGQGCGKSLVAFHLWFPREAKRLHDG